MTPNLRTDRRFFETTTLSLGRSRTRLFLATASLLFDIHHDNKERLCYTTKPERRLFVKAIRHRAQSANAGRFLHEAPKDPRRNRLFDLFPKSP